MATFFAIESFHMTKKYLRWRASRSSAEPTLYSLSTRWDVHFELWSVQFIGCPNQVGLSSWNCVYTMLSHRYWTRAWCQASELGQRVLPSSCWGQPRGFGPSGSKDAGTQRKRPAQSMWTNQKNVGGGFQTESVQAVYGVQQRPKRVHQEIFDKEGPWEGIWAWGVFCVQNRRRASRQIREALLQMVHDVSIIYVCFTACVHASMMPASDSSCPGKNAPISLQERERTQRSTWGRISELQVENSKQKQGTHISTLVI